MDNDTPQFEKDARRMKAGMLTSPLAYRKMYADKKPAEVVAALTDYSSGGSSKRRLDEAEDKAVGVNKGEIGKKWADSFEK